MFLLLTKHKFLKDKLLPSTELSIKQVNLSKLGKDFKLSKIFSFIVEVITNFVFESSSL